MDTFAIVNLRDGQKREVQSFLLDNDAFPVLENAYLFRGRIERRSGTKPVGVDGRLKGVAGTTSGAGAITILAGTAPSGLPSGVSTFVINGDTLTDPGGSSPVTLLTTGVTTAVLTRATGVLATNAPAASVIYIPGLPAMGLSTLEQVSINDERLMAFDTRYTYLFDEGTQDFILQNVFRGTTNEFVWTASDSDFFWSTNYFNAFWATNNIAGFHALVDASPVAERDGIRWYVSDTAGIGWSNFNPAVDGTNFLNGALAIVAYKGRLVVFNTLEGANLAGTTRFPHRARWCQIGTPFYTNSPNGIGTVAAAWRSDQVGKGGFIDAPTQEVIVSTEFIKDTLIVYFERSTWQFVYTGNETLPFVWQKINTELGCESTFSVVPFDRGVFAVGNYGIISTDSVNVSRIDQKIPDEVFQIQNKSEGSKRVHGIRDFNAQLVYWSYPVISELDNEAPTYGLVYPNQVLVYNYLDGSWSQFDDSFTCFGYWQRNSDVSWATSNRSWASTNNAWNSQVLQARYPDVIAGNQRGFVVIFSQLQQVGINTASLPISNINTTTRSITCVAHNLVQNQYVRIAGVLGTTGINGVIYKILSTPTADTFVLDQPVTFPWTGVYTGGGSIIFMPNIFIQTKQFNPYYEQGQSMKLSQIDIFTDNTDQGQFEAGLFVSDNTSNPVETLVVLTAAETAFQLTQNKIWHRFYINAFGSFTQLTFTMNETQMKDLNITTSDLTIHGLVLYIGRSGRLVYEF